MPLTKDEEVQRDYELIARHYLNHPKATVEEAAAALADTIGSDATASRRIRQMKAEDVLVTRTDIKKWKEVGYPFRYRVDVQVDQDALREPKSYGAPQGEEPRDPVDNWRRLAQYIMKDLVPFLESIPASKTVTREKFSKNDVILQNVTILLGQQADLTVTLRARTQSAVLNFVVDGLRALRGVKMTNTSHEAWSYTDGDL